MTSISYKEDRRTSGKVSIKALIALVLVIVSMLMLLFPWISISINVWGENYSLPDIIDLICAYDETTKTEFKAGLQSEFEDMSEKLAYMDIKLNAKKATKTVEKILDGGISPLEAASISSYIGGFLGDIEDVYGHSYADMSIDERMIMPSLSDAKTTLVVAAIFLWLMIIGMLVALAFSVYTLLTDKKSGVLIYTSLSVILFVGFAITVGKMNNAMEGSSNFVELLLRDVLWILGVSSSTALDFKLFNLTVIPFICLICAAAACAIAFQKTAPKLCIPTKKPSGGWACRCGTVNKFANDFCTNCGTKRPKVDRCSCGAELVDGAAFCRICGKKLTTISEKPRCSCGAELVEGTAFCRVCGKKVGTAPATPPPVPPVKEEKRCTRCGKIIYGDVKYCVSCKSIMNTPSDGLTPPSDDDLD